MKPIQRYRCIPSGLLDDNEQNNDPRVYRVEDVDPIITKLDDAIDKTEKLKIELEEYKKRSDWFDFLIDKEKIGTKETPSLKAYIDRLQAENEKLRRILFELYLDSGGNEGCDEIDEKYEFWLKQKLEEGK